MNKILIVEDNELFRQLLSVRLPEYFDEFAFTFAANGEEALEVLEREEVVLVVTDLRMPGKDGFDILAYMGRHCPDVPCIIMSGYDLAPDKEDIAEQAALFLRKPVAPEELAAAITRTLESAPGGTLRGISIVGFLQIVEMEQKTCRLDVSSPEGHVGTMYFVDGELYDAVCGDLTGEEAAMRLVVMDNVHIELRQLATDSVRRAINIGIQSLTMQAMVLKDEEGVNLPPVQAKIQELFTTGVRLCEERRLKQAQETLARLLRIDPANAMGWLWLSRTLGDQTKIKEALSRASHLKPHSDIIRQEVERVRKALAEAGGGRVSRCPFCWAPNAKSAQQCSCCQGYFIVTPAILEDIGHADKDFMAEAVERYQRVYVDRPDPKLLYFIGLAHLNRGDLDRALTTFDELSRSRRSEEFYQQQIDLLLEYLATKKLGPDPEPEHEDAESGEEKSERETPLILVVEDNPVARKVVSMTIRRNGMEVSEARDGVEALKQLAVNLPDVVILDVMLPKLDGYEVLRFMKQRDDWKNIPVIILTGKDSLVEKVKGKVAGAGAYLTKPFQPGELLETLRKLLNT